MTIRTFIVSGDDEGPHQSNGTCAYLSLPDELVDPDVADCPGDIWLKNPKIVSYTPVDVIDEQGLYLQVTDPTWAARGLWQTLSALIRIEDVRELVQEKSPKTLEEIELILALTHDVSTYAPPTIQEEAS